MDSQIAIKLWREQIGQPGNYCYAPSMERIKTYDFGFCDGELYRQANGPDTFQRVLMVFPKHLTAPAPAVAVPFYFPEAMLGFELESRESLPKYAGIAMLSHLVQRGYIAASADAYHLTYFGSPRERGDGTLWDEVGAAIVKDHPEWTGIGKLTADTQLLVTALAEDQRVDAGNIGIAGHSLGGKMAFYAGCLDLRIKAILASDFGMLWERTNWNDSWYWGDKLEKIKALGMEHAWLLGCAAPKPFCLLAGDDDNEESRQMMLRAPGYGKGERLVIYNHGTGHRPPWEVLCQGYDFLDKWLKH